MATDTDSGTGTNTIQVVPMLSSHVDTLESNMDSAGKKKD